MFNKKKKKKHKSKYFLTLEDFNYFQKKFYALI